MDRDGTINEARGHISSIDDMQLIPKVGEAISKLNDFGYLVIVITNQPVVSRGECSFNNLKEIHNKMETLLGYSKAFLDHIYFCPHHPDKGFRESF